MACLTCSRSDAWHRNRIENLEHTIGPVAAQEFEQEHPEDDGDYDDRPEYRLADDPVLMPPSPPDPNDYDHWEGDWR